MYKLYHYTLCPFSRIIRLMLTEKSINHDLICERFWEKRENFIRLNKSGAVPFLLKKRDPQEIESGKRHLLLSGINAIIEYLEEEYSARLLIFGDSDGKAEIRKMIDWINIKFYNEVVEYVFLERIVNFFKYQSVPDPALISIAGKNLAIHIDYFGYLIGKRGWLATESCSLADFVLAAHISTLDYLGFVDWSKMTSQYEDNFKEWYRLMKSRPSFRALLQDVVGGFDASKAYRDLDFT